MEESRKENLRKINFWDKLFEIRDKDRKNQENAIVVVPFEDLPLEVNRQGIMRWYLHPIMEDTVTKPFIFYVQEVPPMGRSGCVKTQGGQIFYIWEGTGYTTMDGVQHNWETGALVQVPLRPAGVAYQHFNTDPKNTARLISVEPNTVGALGLDRASGFEQLEDCPEYEKEKAN